MRVSCVSNVWLWKFFQTGTKTKHTHTWRYTYMMTVCANARAFLCVCVFFVTWSNGSVLQLNHWHHLDALYLIHKLTRNACLIHGFFHSSFRKDFRLFKFHLNFFRFFCFWILIIAMVWRKSYQWVARNWNG